MKYVKTIFIFLSLMIATSLSGQANQQLNNQHPSIRQASRSVVQVAATVNTAQKNLTGFCYFDNTFVVTALHGVAGSNDNITVKFNGMQRRAIVYAILREADLALLKIEAPGGMPGLTPVQLSSAHYQSQEEYYVWGYQLGTNQLNGFRLNFSLVPDGRQATVNSVISGSGGQNANLASKIQQQGYPGLQTSVYLLSFLKPGHSGAPLFNSRGEVVAIGDGGLHEGSSGLNWAIPSSYVSQLAQNPDSDIFAPPTDLDILHSQAYNERAKGPKGPDVYDENGNIAATFLNRMSLGEMLETVGADSKNQIFAFAENILRQVEQQTGERVIYDLEAELFQINMDIYLDQRTNATFAHMTTADRLEIPRGAYQPTELRQHYARQVARGPFHSQKDGVGYDMYIGHANGINESRQITRLLLNAITQPKGISLNYLDGMSDETGEFAWYHSPDGFVITACDASTYYVCYLGTYEVPGGTQQGAVSIARDFLRSYIAHFGVFFLTASSLEQL